MVAAGPSWGLACEEWALHFNLPPGATVDLSTEAVAARVRDLLKLPDLDLRIHHVSEYLPEAVVARAFRVGRVFLAGDAAHRQPPATGLGLNTAIQDGHNIAWKLAAVLAGRADDALLDTYEAERLPTARRNVAWAMSCFMNHGVLHASLGAMPGLPPAAREASFRELLSDTPMGETRRARAREVFATQRTEYQAHDIEIGFAYPDGAIVPDGSPPPPRDPMGTTYHPVARPGHRLPHAWLTRHGERVSSHDLVGNRGGFALLTGPLADDWAVAAKRAAETHGVSLEVVPIDADWPGGIGDDGAVLVRPDNHVAWRSPHGSERAGDELDAVFRRILGRIPNEVVNPRW
jgi:2,4-dichlorophenol 6-monooxygenase